MTDSRLQELLEKWLTQTTDEAEQAELMHFFSLHESAPQREIFAQAVYDRTNTEQYLSRENTERILAEIYQGSPVPVQKTSSSIHRIHLLRTAWFRYAAAILLITGLCVITYFQATNRNQKQTIVKDIKRPAINVPPGGQKAVLTLADGTKIVLDSAANGNLARQGNAQVVKLFNGQIVYNPAGGTAKEQVWNTMSTPVGGQYQVTLPDGTKVWLNAASSITYPTAFVGKERKVKISGEVYFEVARNKHEPFIVNVNGKSVVEVLGTSFNINSYPDEENIKTTLLEGSVRVSKAKASASDNREPTASVMLKPGQQAVITPSRQEPAIIDNVDMVQALAWKNGLFNFNGSDLRSVMKQLERWYDIKVEYEKPVSNDIFKGEMYRNVNLSDVLDMLHEMDVKFRMEGKTLIVTG